MVLEFGEPGEVYNVGGPDELPNIEVVKRILELTGRDESLIEHVTDRLGHDRRYSLASAKTEALGWRAAVGVRRRDRADGRVVPRERVVVAADPLRRVPRTTTSATTATVDAGGARDAARGAGAARAGGARRRARLPARELQRRGLGGGGGRGRLRPGQPLALAPGDPPRPALPDLARAGEAGPLRPRADLGRRGRPAARLADLRPVGGLRARRRRATASSSFRSASRTASACSRRSPTSTTRSRATTTPRPRPGSPGTTPRSRSSWPLADPQVSERDASAPRLAEVADRLPF